MPSFVASLSGLLAFLGLQLAILGDQGSVNLPFDSTLVHFAQLAFVPVVVVCPGGPRRHRVVRQRLRAPPTAQEGQPFRPVDELPGAAVGRTGRRPPRLFAWYLNQERGVGWMVVMFVALVLVVNYAFTRTKWGRSLLAIGGNEEAARRSGVNVRRIYLTAFAVCSCWPVSAASSPRPGSPRRIFPVAPAT
jgi:simple sugar transport system permease protein/D-xylose transport system permease protein